MAFTHSLHLLHSTLSLCPLTFHQYCLSSCETRSLSSPAHVSLDEIFVPFLLYKKGGVKKRKKKSLFHFLKADYGPAEKVHFNPERKEKKKTSRLPSLGAM